MTATTSSSRHNNNDLSATELDSHADSPVVGRNCYIIEHTGKTVKVSGFTKELGNPLEVPVVNAAVAYDCDSTGQTHILIICNALYFPQMDINLIPPIMMRLAGVEVNECPKFLARNPSEEHHSMFFTEFQIRIPFQLEGTISYIPTRRPSMKEMEDNDGNYLLITPNLPSWNPHDQIFKNQEESMTDYKGEIKKSKPKIELLPPQETLTICSIINQSRMDIASDPNYIISAVESLCMEKLEDNGNVNISMVNTTTSRRSLKAETLSKRLKIPLEMAQKTLQATTQLAIRKTDNPSLNRKYRSNDRMLRYTRLATNTFMDTMFAGKKGGKSIRGYKTAQVFATEFGHVFVVPLMDKTGASITNAIKQYFKTVGVPEDIICDQATEQVKGSSRILCHDAGCTIVELEKGTPASNRAERAIKTLKDGVQADLFDSNSPLKLWCYCLERRAAIICSTVRTNAMLKGQTPETYLTGNATDISAISEFGWYEWVVYRLEGEIFPHQSRKLGRTLGPARNAGNALSHWVLTINGKVMPVQTLRHLTEAELGSESMKKRMSHYDQCIKKSLGDSNMSPPENTEESPVSDELYEGWYDEETEYNLLDDDVHEDYNGLLQAEVMLPKNGEKMEVARVIRKVKDTSGMTVGSYHPNLILDTQIYEVMFNDGSIERYAANTIAENIYSQIDENGHRYQLFDAIVNHRSDGSAVSKEDGWTTSKGGKRSKRITTKGWYFLVRWCDGQESWVPLKELKENNPIQVAEYAQMAGIIDEPALAWWAQHALRKRNHIISKIKSRKTKKSHKYGIEVPRTVKEAYELDRLNNNNLWRKAIQKEMNNVRVAFDILDEGRKVQPGRTYLECYLIFDVKMDFTRKARFVANGAKTPDLQDSVYAGVISRETVRIALTYAALNDLQIMAGDIQNAYLQAPISEKYWTILGPEFG